MGTYSRTRVSCRRSARPGRQVDSHLGSKIRGDALVLPVAIAGRFRALRALKFLGARAGRWPRRPACALRPRPARAGPPAAAACVPPADAGVAGGEGSSVMSAFPAIGSISARSQTSRHKAHTRTVKSQRRFLYLAYSHARRCFPFDGMRRNRVEPAIPFFPRCFRSMPPQRFALPSEVPGLAARRIAADILDGVLHKQRTLDDQLDGAGAHPGLKIAARSRPRLDAAAGGDHPAAARHARPCAVAAARSRHSDRRAARAERAADRRRADSLDGRARSRRGRSVGAAGAVGPARREICRARQCGAAPLRARGPAADRRGQVADARCSAMAAGALDRALRRDHRPRDRGRTRPRAVARHHREIRCRAVGDAAARRNAADGNACARCCRAR